MEAAVKMRVTRGLRWWLALLLMSGLLSGLAACNRPLIPAGLQHPAPKSAPTRHQTVSAKWQPDLGVDIYAKDNYSTQQVQAWGVRDLRYIIHVLRVPTVGIAWNLFTPFDHSNQVVQEPTDVRTGGSGGHVQIGSTMTPAKVAILTRLALKDDLSLEYRPLVKVEGPRQWEGYIAPYNITTWFQNYFTALRPYLLVAQRYRVREVVVATELADLEKVATAAQWATFFQQVRSVYSGKISYAAWGGHYFKSSSRAIPQLSLYGITGYPDFHFPKISCPANPTVDQLVAKWIAEFGQVPASLRALTSIDELGMPAGCGAWNSPWNWDKSYPPDQIAQARWFTAACMATKDLRLRGLYFWNVNFGDDPYHPPAGSEPSFEGKLGAHAIGGCQKILAS